jgi:hypothetical protein
MTIRPADRRPGRSRWGSAAGRTLVALLFASLLAAGAAVAQEVRRVDDPPGGTLRSLPLSRTDGDRQDRAARDLFAAIARAMTDSDHEALAALVADQGVTIAMSPDPDRDSHYSPSQAYYFFRNLFQSARSESFRFSRLQDGAEGGRIHGVADWSYRRTGAEETSSERLIFTIILTESRWGLAEIRAIR